MLGHSELKDGLALLLEKTARCKYELDDVVREIKAIYMLVADKADEEECR
ncbi:hypothetical protein kuro4_00930 [Gelria sp. Kuro-4]|nr:hypothetical protein kuro4_00930 [Gelria sp. Kuro-4]